MTDETESTDDLGHRCEFHGYHCDGIRLEKNVGTGAFTIILTRDEDTPVATVEMPSEDAVSLARRILETADGGRLQ